MNCNKINTKYSSNNSNISHGGIVAQWDNVCKRVRCEFDSHSCDRDYNITFPNSEIQSARLSSA